MFEIYGESIGKMFFLLEVIKLHGSGPSTAYACKSFFERFQVLPHKVTVTWAPYRDVLLA